MNPAYLGLRISSFYGQKLSFKKMLILVWNSHMAYEMIFGSINSNALKKEWLNSGSITDKKDLVQMRNDPYCIHWISPNFKNFPKFWILFEWTFILNLVLTKCFSGLELIDFRLRIFQVDPNSHSVGYLYAEHISLPTQIVSTDHQF